MYCNGRRCMNSSLASLHSPNGTVLHVSSNSPPSPRCVHAPCTGAWPGRQGSRVAADCGVRSYRTVLTAACAKLKWFTSSVLQWGIGHESCVRVRRPRGQLFLPLVPCIAIPERTLMERHTTETTLEPKTHPLVPSGRRRFGRDICASEPPNYVASVYLRRYS